MKRSIYYFLFFLVFPFSSQAQKWLWGRQGNQTCETWGVAADNNGNGYLTGPFGQSIIFGKDTLSTTYSGQFLVKFDSTGNVQWGMNGKTINYGDYSTGTVVAADNLGNSFIGGHYLGTVIFGTDTIRTGSGTSHIYIVKYDSSGNVDWVRQSNQSFYANPSLEFITADVLGNVYAIGNFGDTVSFGTDTLKGNFENVFIVKYASNGNALWARSSANRNNGCKGIGNSVAINTLGEVYVTGYFSDTISFGKDTLRADFRSQIFIVKYDVNGNEMWARQSTSKAGFAQGNSIVTDASGNVYMLGDFNDTISIGTVKLKRNSLHNNIFLIKLNPNGFTLWAKQSNENVGNWQGNQMVIDNNNHIYIVESAGGGDSMVFCNDTMGMVNDGDLSAILEVDTSGNTTCGIMVNAGGDDQNGIACSSSGKYIYFGGDLFDTITFGKNFLNPAIAGGEPPFIARWQPCQQYINPQGLNEMEPTKTLYMLFPNPNNGRFTIGLVNNNMSVIDVYNSLGEKIYSANIQYPQDDVQIDLHSQPAGIYLYRAMKANGTEQFSGKFIIQ